MTERPVEIEVIFRSIDDLSEALRLEVIIATQNLLSFESVNILRYINQVRFENPATSVEIRQKERKRIPEKTRKNTT